MIFYVKLNASSRQGESGLKSKQEPNNCITCGVDLNHCADKDLDNNQCGFCSPKKQIKNMKIEGQEYEIKSTIPLKIMFTIMGTFIVCLVMWQADVPYLPIWIMSVSIAKYILWSIILGETIVKPISIQSEDRHN